MNITPDIRVMGARLVLAILVTGTFVTLGFWANEGPAGVFAWMATAVTATGALLLSGMLRHASLGNLRGGRFAPALQIIEGHPLFRILATDRVARWAVAGGFGLAVATAESAVSASILAGVESQFLRGVLALAVVLIPAWSAAALLTTPDPAGGFWGRLGAAVADGLGLEAREVGRFGRAVAGATLRTAVTVGVRSVLVLALPMVFASPWAVAFCALAAVTVITAGDVLVDLMRALRGTVHVEGETTQTSGASGGRPEASEPNEGARA